MRKIEPKMIEYIDAKLAGNGSAQHAIETKSARDVFIYAMESLVGIREKGGNNRGPLVELIQKTVGGHSAESWCLSTVMTGLAYAEHKCGILSKLPATEHCLTLWSKAPASMKVRIAPARGAIAIWQHGTSSNGHTGMFVEVIGKKKMLTVEGNTESGTVGDAVVRDGGGVYRNTRSMTIGAGKMKLLGFLKPF